MSYRGQAHNIREIGQALNVATVLEGSVRREGNRVRVNVQLIDASNDAHLWAQIYDRELTDIFAVQSELAREIAAALKATLSPSERSGSNRRATENSEAYLFTRRRTIFSPGPDRHHRRSGPQRRTLRKGDPARSDLRAGSGASCHIWRAGFFTPLIRWPRAAKSAGGGARSVASGTGPARGHLALGYRPLLYRARLRRALDELATARKGAAERRRRFPRDGRNSAAAG